MMTNPSGRTSSGGTGAAVSIDGLIGTYTLMSGGATLTFTTDLTPPVDRRQWCPYLTRREGHNGRHWVLVRHGHSVGGSTADSQTRLRNRNGHVIFYTHHGAIKKARRLNRDIPLAPDTETPLLQHNRKLSFKKTHDLEGMEKAELITLVQEMLGDWEELNRIHNNRAESNSWCDQYEIFQDSHNKRFKALRLVGRQELRGGMVGPGL